MYSFKEFISDKHIEEALNMSSIMSDVKSGYNKAIAGVKNPDLIKKMEVLHGVVKGVSEKHGMQHDEVLKSVGVDQFFHGE